MGSNPVRHIDDPFVLTEQVTFVGTASTSFDQGIWLCYNVDYGTATDTEGSRGNRVEVPSLTNCQHVAGVSLHDFKTNSSGVARVQIAKPGSICYVKAAEDTVIDTTRLTYLVGGGNNTSRACDLGFSGRGTVIALETNTTLLEDHRDGAYDDDNLAADGLTLTVADSSDYTAGVDKCLILSGENNGTGAVVPGIYDFTITDDTTIVLTSSAVTAAPGATLSCSFVIIDGDNDLILAKLEDGSESCGVYYSSPANAGGVTTVYNPFGKNYVQGTDLAADSDYTFAQGEFFDQHCGFFLRNAHNGNDTTVDLAENGFTMAGGALTEVQALDAQGEYCYFNWRTVWRTTHTNGTEA